MTIKEKVRNMFKDANGWKKGIRNGLTYVQIIYKLGKQPKSREEFCIGKRNLRLILWALTEEAGQDGLFFYGLPFGKKYRKIFFITANWQEHQRCLVDWRRKLVLFRKQTDSEIDTNLRHISIRTEKCGGKLDIEHKEIFGDCIKTWQRLARMADLRIEKIDEFLLADGGYSDDYVW